MRPATVFAVLEASSLEHNPCPSHARPTGITCMIGARQHEELLREAFNLRLDLVVGKPLTMEHQSGYVPYHLVNERPADARCYP